ncbi:uncharacterized protein LOC143429142 [Xylocopa sonorina]|uniref:uncharacterized protein LOC143429142 n=1 Tax=Xylocopa sonorina TaxID=1818115 RepID=UPI00403ABBB3
MDEQRQAISFANSYFALADGLATGLESHLSEDVVLDWFGKTVRGRRNVSAFLGAHKVNSRHVFPHIVPITGIDYEKIEANRKRFRSHRYQSEQECLTKSSNNDASETEVSLTRNGITDINQNEIGAKEAIARDDYNFDDGDLSNLFKLEISSTNTEEIELSINRIKLEEEMAPTIKAIKREQRRGDGSLVVEPTTVKYVEACGEIEFSRKYGKRGKDSWNAYFLVPIKLHTWKRPCKLQIAYTTSSEYPTATLSRKNKSIEARYGQPKVKLPSLNDINEITNRLVPNANGFGGFLKDIDFFEDRKSFLESLETKMMTKDPCTPLFVVPQYVEDRLVFKKRRVSVADSTGDKNKKTFVFNYQIRLIVYESNSKCKVNLMQEFEEAKL